MLDANSSSPLRSFGASHVAPLSFPHYFSTPDVTIRWAAAGGRRRRWCRIEISQRRRRSDCAKGVDSGRWAPRGRGLILMIISLPLKLSFVQSIDAADHLNHLRERWIRPIKTFIFRMKTCTFTVGSVLTQIKTCIFRVKNGSFLNRSHLGWRWDHSDGYGRFLNRSRQGWRCNHCHGRILN